MTPEVILLGKPRTRTEWSNSMPDGPRFIRFGSFEIDQQRQEVTKNGSPLKLQGKAYQVLIALLQKPGAVITREELRQQLWPADTHVNFDANVNTTVNKLRQVLGDCFENPIYIKTIPRRGYSFVAQFGVGDAPTAPVDKQNLLQAISRPGTVFSRLLHYGRLNRPFTWNVLGLILIGMILGAGIVAVWISHLTVSGVPH